MIKKEKRHRLRRKGIYLLPNLCTTIALFFGFYAAVGGTQGHFVSAAIAIFIAMIFDGLDGRIARMTNTTSAFGAEYDSLSDMVTFGIAPALLAYDFVLFHLGKAGWLIAFLYASATALRLARFNTQLGTASKRYFQGLPCPSAAAAVASFIWLLHRPVLPFLSVNTSIPVLSTIMAVLVTGVALLMVSNMPYYSFKEINVKGKFPFIIIVVCILLMIALAYDPSLVLFLAFFAYVISGFIVFFFTLKKQKKSPFRLSSYRKPH
jgi:CDP-diacylglycerol--serine O-phosphatidyltransferase